MSINAEKNGKTVLFDVSGKRKNNCILSINLEKKVLIISKTTNIGTKGN